MKKLLITFAIIFLIPATCLPDNFFGQAGWHETTCNICGKTIYYYDDPHIFEDNMLGVYVGSTYGCPGEKSFDIEGMSGCVCHDCLEKYSSKYRDWCLEFFDKVRKENKDLRIQYDEQRKHDMIQDKLNKIESLKKELEKIQE